MRMRVLAPWKTHQSSFSILCAGLGIILLLCCCCPSCVCYLNPFLIPHFHMKMRFSAPVLLLLWSNGSVDAFSPQNAAEVAKNAVFRKPAFTAPSVSNPFERLPPITLPDVSLPSVTLPSTDRLIQDMSDFLNQSSDSLTVPFQQLVSNLQNELQKANLPTEVLQEFATKIQSAVSSFVESHPELGPLYSSIQSQLTKIQLDDVPATVVVGVSALVSYTIISSLLLWGKEAPPSQPYPDGKYNATSARAYFDDNFLQVIARGIEVATNSLGFGIGILQDYLNDKLEENAERRAVELSKLLTTLGPSFIKIGQSLSIRTDLLSPAYVRGLQTLQDQVPPFSTTVAKQILEQEWGRPIDTVVSYISPEPVAAASLGQVYKATLKESGMEVAIKVQRPNIMNQIALDMHLLREIAPVAKAAFNLNTDTVGTVDTWGIGFVDELDYMQEARNAETFTETIQTTPLKDVVFAPPVVNELSTKKVLTTEWVDGERLDKSAQEDVTILCSIAMNTYLTMMLETGLLHCDPHPGNLLRTPDGRLCILDWGMVTRLDSDLQLTLIEHMAHLTSADYEEIPRDLLLLDFIPQEKADLISDSGVVEVLADIYGAWTKGGGAATVNVNKVVAQLQDLTATRGNLFQIPPYFAYIAKSFSVLEGIGLSNDPKFSIIKECLPYVSKRLLTDKSERTGGALSTFIFGPDKANIDTRLVDYDRIEQLVTGYGNYSTSASGALLGQEGLTRTQLLDNAADQLLDLIVTEEETPLQNILIEQLAKLTAANSRSIWADLREQSGTLPSGRTVLGTLVDPLGFWRTSPLIRMNEQDLRTVHTTQKLISLMQQQIKDNKNPMLDISDLSQEESLELSRLLASKAWSRRSAFLKTGNRFANQLLKLTADKLERGERDTIVRLPDTPPEREEGVIAIEEVPSAAHRKESVRLSRAKKLLAELESGNDDFVPELVVEIEKDQRPHSISDATNNETSQVTVITTIEA